MKKIALVLGTARKDNFSQKIAEISSEFLKEKNKEIEFVDVANYLFGKTVSSKDEGVKKWAEIISRVDGVIFVTPEYNHSYPGELKILIDSLYEEYEGKLAGIISVSAGQYGGVSVAEKLNDLLHTVNFSIAHSVVNVSFVQKNIDMDKVREHLETLVSEMGNMGLGDN